MKIFIQIQGYIKSVLDTDIMSIGQLPILQFFKRTRIMQKINCVTDMFIDRFHIYV
jgi:hypothetical protein